MLKAYLHASVNLRLDPFKQEKKKTGQPKPSRGMLPIQKIRN
jgi:hypothetical protein